MHNMITKLILIPVILLCLNINKSFSNDYPDLINEKLAKSCMSLSLTNSIAFYDIELKKNFKYRNATKFEMEKIPSISTRIYIIVEDISNQEYEVACYFTSEIKINCIEDPYNLKSSKNSFVTKCYHKPQRWRYGKNEFNAKSIK